MTLKSWLTGAAGALTIGLIGLPADAAPTGGLPALQSPPMTDVQQANWYGRRHGYRCAKKCAGCRVTDWGDL